MIIGGREAPRGRFPYFTTLEHYCGGALIAPDTIITAGHCKPKHVDDVRPHVGRYTFYDDDTSKAYDVIATERHPKWEILGEDDFRHDISLLFLEEAVPNTPYLRLNRNASQPLPGEQVTAMGVGWTSSDYRHAKKAMVLQEVHLNYLPRDQCELSTNEDHVRHDKDIIRYEGRIHADHLCTTGGPNNERDGW